MVHLSSALQPVECKIQSMTVLQKAKKKVRAVALRLSQTADVTPECNETTPECQENYLKVKISSTQKNSSRGRPIFINIRQKLWRTCQVSQSTRIIKEQTKVIGLEIVLCRGQNWSSSTFASFIPARKTDMISSHYIEVKRLVLQEWLHWDSFKLQIDTWPGTKASWPAFRSSQFLGYSAYRGPTTITSSGIIGITRSPVMVAKGYSYW